MNPSYHAFVANNLDIGHESNLISVSIPICKILLYRMSPLDKQKVPWNEVMNRQFKIKEFTYKFSITVLIFSTFEQPPLR